VDVAYRRRDQSRRYQVSDTDSGPVGHRRTVLRIDVLAQHHFQTLGFETPQASVMVDVFGNGYRGDARFAFQRAAAILAR